MKTQTFTRQLKTLRVSGRTWNGQKTKHNYNLHVIGRPDLEGVEPKNMAHAKLIAGDFAELDRATLIITDITENRTVTRRRIQ
jgi:hypothetical protein